MKLKARVHGLELNVPCGEGKQNIKWLGLVVAQRYAQVAPHGRCRTREDAHIKRGFFIPASVSKAVNGQELPPTKTIVDCCRDNEVIQVTLQQEVPVNEIGNPMWSPWTKLAFNLAHEDDALVGNEADSKTASPAIRHRKMSTNDAKQAKDTESHSAVDTPAMEDLVSYAREEYYQKVTSTQPQTEMELEAAFLYDWKRLDLFAILPQELQEPGDEGQETIQSLLQDHFQTLCTIYHHYTIGASGVDMDAVSMDETAFVHFAHECGLQHFRKDASHLHKLVLDCTDNPAFVQDKAASKYGPTLTRAGFIHVLLSSAIPMAQEIARDSQSTLHKALDNILTDKVAGTVEKLTSGPFRDHTHHDVTLSAVQGAFAKLQKLYRCYANTNDQLLHGDGLKCMLYDAGLFCSEETVTHDTAFSNAMEQCFSGNQEVPHVQDQVVAFAEMIEVSARVALGEFKSLDLAPEDTILVVIDAFRRLSTTK